MTYQIKNLIELISYICGLVSVLFLFMSMMLVIINIPTFDFRVVPISALGMKITTNSQVFNRGIIISGILLIPLFISFQNYLNQHDCNRILRFLILISGFLLACGEIGAGIFPAGIQYGYEHGKVAFIIFQSSLFLSLLTSIFLIENENTKYLGYFGFISFVILGIFLYIREPWLEWISLMLIWVWIASISGFLAFHMLKNLIKRKRLSEIERS